MKSLQEYGPVDCARLENGGTIEVLPTCTTPLDLLREENWRPLPMGNTRPVFHVRRYENSHRPGLYVKSPERAFTASEKILARDTVWWGGPRSGEKRVWVRDPIVEEQVVWEAVFLLELERAGLLAERPQAILTSNTGQKRLVVSEIQQSFDCSSYCLSETEIQARVTALGFEPDDLSSHNLLLNRHGRWIIDVNRWHWPPHTNTFRMRRLACVKETLKKVMASGYAHA